MQIIFSRKTILAFLAALVPATLAQGGRKASLAAKGQGREAFDSVVVENSDHLRRFISRRVREGDREDVLQETWLRAWQGFGSFDGRSSVRTWLYSVCYHTVQDHWRREQIRPVSGDIFQDDEGATYFPSEFAGVELREAMRGYWDSCTPGQRELLSMYYSEGLALPEISRILNRNLNTVKYQFYRAHEEAREKLLGSAPEESWGWKR
jgi:RNA polymerase sigma-70 factor (ECF subfamily)